MAKNKYYVILGLLCLQYPGLSQTESNPVIPDFGTIWNIQEVSKPNPELNYKIVVDLKSPITDPTLINAGLNNVARMLNLHVTGGIPKDKISVTIAIHGLATASVMNNDGYSLKYGVDNPNLELIRQLKNAGVDLYVCGQSLIARNYDREKVNPDIKIALSMLTVVTERMMQGYGLLVFN